MQQVRDLIAELERFDPRTPVFVSVWKGDETHQVEIAGLRREEDSRGGQAVVLVPFDS